MKFKSEDDIKKELEVDSWKNMPRDKMIRFVALLPNMDKEVAMKIIEQFPEFTKFAIEALGYFERQYTSTLSANKESQPNFHKACQDIRDILRGELKQEDLSSEQRKVILDMLLETARMESQKDTENKEWLKRMSEIAAWRDVRTFVGVAGFLALFLIAVNPSLGAMMHSNKHTQ